MIKSSKIKQIKQSKNLSWFQKMLFMELLEQATQQNQKEIDILNSELIELLNVGKTYLKVGLHALEKQKLITRIFKKNGSLRVIRIVGFVKYEKPTVKKETKPPLEQKENPAFESFWEAYKPIHTNKGSKIESKQLYEKIINQKITTKEHLLKCTEAYIKACHDKGTYTKNVPTFLNPVKKHWESFTDNVECDDIIKIVIVKKCSDFNSFEINFRNTIGRYYYEKYFMGKIKYIGESVIYRGFKKDEKIANYLINKFFKNNA